MARAARIALDLALVSLSTVRPVVSKVWSAAKTKIISTPAKPLVSNPVVIKVESILDQIVDVLVSKITAFRDHQLVGELRYLEKEVEKVKKKITTSKELNRKLAIVWRYAKTELAPPMTISYLHGPAGQKLEGIASNAAESFITSLSNKIKEIDAEEERAKKEKEVALNKAIEKAKAEEKKIADEKKKDVEKLMKVAKQSHTAKEETAAKKPEPFKKETKKNPNSK